jgi:isopenicillin-N N-acyltransferase-like protein
MKKLPIIEVSGDFRSVGQQIGRACRPQIERALQALPQYIPSGISWKVTLDESAAYLDCARAVYPQYISELEGIAEGAGVPFEEVFLSVCEELAEPAAWLGRGCSDMAARGPATADGSTIVAHTNDLLLESEENLVILKVKAGDEPEFLGISPGGIGYSAGFNACGISLTGNHLDQNDIRPGVPRLLVVRAIIASRSMFEAMTHCLLRERASSYNNLIADGNGEVYCMEGSATDCVPLYIQDHVLVHTNHYLDPQMRHFQAHPEKIAASIYRYHRARRLLGDHFGKLTPELFRQLLADHADFPTSICRHGPKIYTIFSIIVQPKECTAWIAKGRPCEGEWVQYRLEPEIRHE